MKLPLLIATAMLALAPATRAQNFSYTTLAGAADSGTVDGTGAAARFSGPADVAVTASGDLLVVERNNAVLRSVTAAGVVTTVASLGNPGAAVAVDAAGNAYISDPVAHVIRKVTPTGAVTLFAGAVGVAGSADGAATAARFNRPNGLAFDSAGNLYIADTGNQTVRRIATDGTVTTYAGLAGVYGSTNGPAPLARFSSPMDVAVDAAGEVFVADTGNMCIRKIGADGTVSTFAGRAGYYSGAVDGTGTAASFGNPVAVASDAAGNLIVSDGSYDLIRKVSAAGVVTTVGGASNVPAAVDGIGTLARFSNPVGVALDAAGNVYVADTANNRIRVGALMTAPSLTTQPVAATVASGGTATFVVAVNSAYPATYQWQRQVDGVGPFVSLTDSAPFSGVLTPTLTVTGAATTLSDDQFRCVVDNGSGSPLTTAAVALQVTAPPAITSGASATFYVGLSGTFTVVATGSPAPTFSITSGALPSWATLDAATGVISGTATSTSGSPFSFTVSAANGVGTAATQSFTLTVNPAPTLPTVNVATSARTVVTRGQSFTLSGSATGTGPITYQWKRNGMPIAGATNTSFTVANAAPGDTGYYQLVATNGAGSSTSAARFVGVAYAKTEVIGWGMDSSIPTGLTNVIAVSAGGGHGLALNADGTVTAWGSNSYGEATVPTGLSNVVAVSAGADHSLALKADGTVVAWGANGSGQTNVPAGLTNVVAIAAGSGVSVALKGDGTVVAWGSNFYSQATVPAGLTDVVAIAAGPTDPLALRSNGSVVAWGYVSGGVMPSSWVNLVGIATGNYMNLAVKADGTVVSWGSSSSISAPPTGLTGVVSVAVSYNQAVALKSDGTVVTWGDDYSDTLPLPASVRSVVQISAFSSLRLALRDASNDVAPVITSSPASAAANQGQSVTLTAAANSGTGAQIFQWYKNGTAIAGATNATYPVTVSTATVGQYYATVTNALGSATTGTATVTMNATPSVDATHGGRYPLTVGDSLTLALSSSISSSATVQWRRNGRAITGATSRTYSITKATRGDGGYYQAVYNVGSGAVISAAVFVPVAPAITQVLAFGSGSSGLTVPAGLTHVVSADMYGSTSMVVNADGTVAVWGTSATTPSGITNAVAVAAGGMGNYVLLADGTVTAWNTSYYMQWQPPAGLSNVVAISAGADNAMALRGDGTVVAWGNAPAASAVPASLTGVVAVAAGSGYELALKSDGTVIGWGQNDSGQSTPPAGLTNVTAIAAGASFAAALRADGTIVVWGNSSGYGTSLKGVTSATGVVAISASDYNLFALRSDGSVLGWGSYGYYSPAVQPVSTGNVMAVAAGTQSVLLVRDASADTVPTIVTQPAAATVYAGQSATLSVGTSAGTAALAYQWDKDGAPIPGATAASLLLPYATATAAGGYTVSITDQFGSITSNAANITFNSTPAVALSPTGRQALTAGQSLTVTGSSPLPGPVTYQWLHNGAPVPGATTATLNLTNATWRTNGAYQLVATNSVGPAISTPVYVGVAVGPQIVAWGSAPVGMPTTGLGDVIQVAAGNAFALALKNDGTVVAWGDNGAHQCEVPAGLNDVVAIAAGDSFALALNSQGVVTAWGRLNFVPTQVGRAVAIAATPNGVGMALRSDGTVVTWDTNGVRTDVPAGLTRVVAIAGGSYYQLALRSDGTVVQWGTGTVPVPDAATSVIAVAAGSDFAAALKADGTVLVWGSNGSGPTQVPAGLSQVVAIATGSANILAIKSDGSAVGWGSDYYSITSGAAMVAPAYTAAIGGYFGIALRNSAGDYAPTINAIPSAQALSAGGTLTLSVSATAVPPPSYQWYKNGIALSGATSSTYSLSSVTTSSAGTYTVAVTNAKGTTVSSGIDVTVSPVGNVRGLLVSSTRVQTPSGRVDGSFTVEGTTAKKMLIRAVGPALTAFGVTGVMSNPQLTVTDASGVAVAANDDWGAAPVPSDIATAAAQVGAFALPVGGKDAALVRTFAPGTYHVAVTPGTGTGGAALLEIYDADTTPRLVYAATLASAAGGDGVLVQGITLAQPPIGRSYLVRALGPSLRIAGALAHPQIAVFDSTNTQVAANAGWGDDPAISSIGDSVGAQPLPSGSADAALNFVPPSVGTYTVQVHGAAGESGLVLVEVFEVDANRATALAPAMVAPPQDASALPGGSATFGVVAVGKPAPAFQWRKDGVAIAGATNSTLTLSNVQAADAAGYSVIATNATGTAVSPEATLTVVTQAATQAVVGGGYIAGGTLTVTNTLTYTGTASSLGWTVTLPVGWSFASGSGAQGDVAPAVGATGTLEWAWTTPPASPVVFTYTVNVPAGETAAQAITAAAIVRANGASETSTVAPATLSVDEAPLLHSADTNADSKLSLLELTRVIELYNTRNGTSRTGCYVVQDGTEDGFAPDATRLGTATVTLTRYHSADTNHDGKISLLELTRVIELYNYRSGTSRTGQYHVQAGTEDGFAPGP